MVSHSLLVLVTARKWFWSGPLINIELKATWIESTSEGRPDFESNLKLIIIFVSRFIRLLWASLNFVPVNRLWESPRNYPMKSLSNCLSQIIIRQWVVVLVVILETFQGFPSQQCSFNAEPGLHRQTWTSWYKFEKPGCYVWMTILNFSANLWWSSATSGKYLTMANSSALVQRM